MPGLFFGGRGARENHFKLTQGGGGGVGEGTLLVTLRCYGRKIS